MFDFYLDLLRKFFDCLYDEDIIKDKVFFKWESSKDPAECLGKGAALKSVNSFFTRLQLAYLEGDFEPYSSHVRTGQKQVLKINE